MSKNGHCPHCKGKGIVEKDFDNLPYCLNCGFVDYTNPNFKPGMAPRANGVWRVLPVTKEAFEKRGRDISTLVSTAGSIHRSHR